MNRSVILILFSACLAAASGQIEKPRLRPSPYFGSITGIDFGDIDDLGTHNYERTSGENNPLLYTAKAGYIDIGHLRESADRARYLFERCRACILAGDAGFSFQIIEPAHYEITLTYPDNWNDCSPDEQAAIAREVAIEVGQHLAQQTTIWHEIITWYGYSSVGLLSEQPSSFSWEDTYSDLLGTKIAAKVLRENDKPYNEAMTGAIAMELAMLGQMSAKTAKKATQTIDGKWFAGRYPFLIMKKRNFDVGFDDGAISPFRVPNIRDDAPVQTCEVPQMEALQNHGFQMHIELTPNSSQGRQALEIIYPDGGSETLTPADHFPQIIDHIRAEAIQKQGPKVDNPTLD